ncbi:MAG TPA: hypothetical protein VLL54_06245 [Pyrinomonadaceae bacterium]|nr:hypothetical protein [Pyrinomonadaceae bacterium]
MTESELLTLKLTPRVLLQEMNFRGWNFCSTGAAFGLALGILCPLVASVFTMMSWFTGPTWHGFSIQRYGTALFVLTIPLLLLGAHCLDLMEKEDDGRAVTSNAASSTSFDRKEKGNELEGN